MLLLMMLMMNGALCIKVIVKGYAAKFWANAQGLDLTVTNGTENRQQELHNEKKCYESVEREQRGLR
jgi:hypothetical protein